MAYLNSEQLRLLGFRYIGSDVRVFERASFYGIDRISIGDECRIDDYCVVSAGEGGIAIGRNVHIAVYSSLIGNGAITLGDFSGLSSRVSIYSSSDDYSGEFMTNPTVTPEFTGVRHAQVIIGRHVIVGSGSVILPGVVLHEGAAVGALTVIRDNCEPFTIYAGNPARRVGLRKRNLLELETAFLRTKSRGT